MQIFHYIAPTQRFSVVNGGSLSASIRCWAISLCGHTGSGLVFSCKGPCGLFVGVPLISGNASFAVVIETVEGGQQQQ